MVSHIKAGNGTSIRHNVPGTRYDANTPSLEAHARSQMKASPVRLSRIQAELLLDQLIETANVSQWA